MRKLSTIKGAESFKVLGAMMPVISRMIRKTGTKVNRGDALEFFGTILEQNPEDAVELVAIIDGKTKEEYADRNILEVLKDISALLTDEDILMLFESQMQSQTSSTSVSESIEVNKK